MRSVGVGLCIALLLAGPGAPAQVAARAVTFPSGQALLRSPAVDGVYDPVEWTDVARLQTPAGEYVVGAGWDSSHVYFLLDGPAFDSAVLYVDAQGDGWLNGPDNYELALIPVQGGQVEVAAKIYNSLVSVPAQALSPAIVDCQARSSLFEGRRTLEVALARNDATGLRPAAGQKMAFGFGVRLPGEQRTAPEDPRGQLTGIVLSNNLVSAPEGIVMDMTIKDRTVTGGQAVSGDLFVTNTGRDPLPYAGLEIAGERRVADLVNRLQLPAGSIEPGKRLKQGYSTALPVDAPVGAYALQATLDLGDGRQAVLLSGFEVLETLEVRMEPGDGPVMAGQERRVAVVVKNNSPRAQNGTVQLEAPVELDGCFDRASSRFMVRPDGEARVEFRLRPNRNTQAGEYELKAAVQSGSFQRTVSGKVLIGR